MQSRRFLISLLVTITHVHILSVAAKSVSRGNVEKKNNLCTDKSCRKIASDILANLDHTVDPCDDFFQFVCGGWIKNNPVPKSYEQISTIDVINKKVMYQVKEILEEKSKPNDSLSLKKARRVYAMCMDYNKIVDGGISPVIRVMENNDLWPIFMDSTEWKKRGYNTWQKVSDVMHTKLLRNGLYDITVDKDNQNFKKNMIIISYPSISFAEDEIDEIDEIHEMTASGYKKQSYQSAVEYILYNISNDANVFANSSMIAEIASQTVDFEVDLIKLVKATENRKQLKQYYLEVTISELQLLYDKSCRSSDCYINWFDVLSRLFASQNITITLLEKIELHAYQYLIDLIPLLQRTPFSIIANYIRWTFVKNAFPFVYTGHYIFDKKEPRSSYLTRDSRWWMNCVKKFNLFIAISREYTKRILDDSIVKDVDDIIMEISNVTRDNIVSCARMDEPTKQVALEKLNHMIKYVGTPDWFSNAAIDRYYHDLNITEYYFDNIININKFEWKEKLLNLRRLIEPIDRDGSFVDATSVNAFLSDIDNAIFLPTAILQEPIYNIHYPLSIKYGSLGFMIGHEINHAFDNKGYNYDKDGTFGKWWTQKSIDLLKQNNKCFIKQYDDYKVNGQFTLEENIADAAGIVAAYEAYKRKKAKLGEHEIHRLDIEEYSEDQIFFISVAFKFCENNPWLRIADKHLDSERRIRGSLSNFPAFSVAYNCSIGQKMNPHTKCFFWQK